MFSFLGKNYWRFGFYSKLYDWLTPEAYRESLRRSVEKAPVGSAKVWLDAGCGSGLLLEALRDRMDPGSCYLGTDLLMPGLESGRGKAQAMGLKRQILLFKSDLTRPLPVRPSSVDVIVAHFSVYTSAPAGDRRRIWENLHPPLKPGGILVTINPVTSYDPKRIVRHSLEEDRRRYGSFRAWIKKWFVYPMTLNFGLKFVARRLRRGEWHAYTGEGLIAELRAASWTVVHTETVYGGCACLAVAHRSPPEDGETGREEA